MEVGLLALLKLRLVRRDRIYPCRRYPTTLPTAPIRDYRATRPAVNGYPLITLGVRINGELNNAATATELGSANSQQVTPIPTSFALDH